MITKSEFILHINTIRQIEYTLKNANNNDTDYLLSVPSYIIKEQHLKVNLIVINDEDLKDYIMLVIFIKLLNKKY